MGTRHLSPAYICSVPRTGVACLGQFMIILTSFAAGPPEDPHWWEAVPVHVEGVRVEVCAQRRTQSTHQARAHAALHVQLGLIFLSTFFLKTLLDRCLANRFFTFLKMFENVDSLIRVWLPMHNNATFLGSMPASSDTAKSGGAAWWSRAE